MSEGAYREPMERLYEALPTMTAAERREHYEVRSHQVGALRSVVRARGHEFAVDEPEGWGSDSAANPAELALAALGASLEVTCRVYADYLGIGARRISTVLSGDLDLGSFLGAPDAGRPGFSHVVASLVLETEGIEESRVQELADRVRRCCPMLDVFTSAIPVDVTVKADPGVSTRTDVP
jgi:uncharacterized OsmC-like protein